MIEQIYNYFTIDVLYYWVNFGVLPFWFLLIIAPNNQITNFFTQTVIAPLLLAVGYSYLSYTIYLEGNILAGFELYNGLDGLYSMFADEAVLLIFWLHFLAISLFAGGWIVRDSKKYLIPKIITIPSLILTYFTGPIGIVFYWLIRIFFAKKISFND